MNLPIDPSPSAGPAPDPRGSATDESGTPGRRVLALLEIVAAIVAALVLTALLTVPFVVGHLDTRLELALEAADGAEDPRPPEEVRSALDALEIADRVHIVRDDTGVRLVLAGVPSVAEATAAASTLVEEAGYRRTEVQRSRGLDLGALLEARGAVIFSIQALVFIVIGTVLARLRLAREAAIPSRVSPTILWGVGGGLLAFGGSAALGILLQWLGFPVAEQEWVEQLFSNPDTVWGFAPWIVLIVPFSEEIFFRWYALRFLTQRLGFRPGLLLSSGLFALIHFNLSGFFVYFLIGVVLGLIYRRTRRLAAPVLGHVTHNALVLCVSLIATAATGGG